jgi:hypothetical protein
MSLLRCGSVLFVLPQLRCAFARFGEFERGTVAGSTDVLDDGMSFVLRKAEAGQRITQKPECDLPLAHDRKAYALRLEVSEFGNAMRPHRRIDLRVEPPRQFENVSLLEACRNGHD